MPEVGGTRIPYPNRLRAWIVWIDVTSSVVPTAVRVLLLTLAPVALGLVVGPVEALFIIGYAVLLVAAGLALWRLRSRPPRRCIMEGRLAVGCDEARPRGTGARRRRSLPPGSSLNSRGMAAGTLSWFRAAGRSSL